MKIAVTAETDSGLDAPVAGHFGHAPYFAFVDVTAGHVTGTMTVENPFLAGHEPGQIPAYIHSVGAQAMLSGGMGARAIAFFAEYGIATATGSFATVGDAVDAFLSGSAESAEACADGHDHHH